MNNQAAQTMPELPERVLDLLAKHGGWAATLDYIAELERAISQTAGVAAGWRVSKPDSGRAGDSWEVYAPDGSGGVVSSYDIKDLAVRDLLDALAAAPAASGVHPDALPDGTLSKSTAKRVEVLAGASVSERARGLLAAEYEAEGWMTEAGACRRGSLDHADRFALSAINKLIEQGDEDDHVITELGRLLAEIAVVLKGPEPAGTAWSYHDLPEMVKALTTAPVGERTPTIVRIPDEKRWAEGDSEYLKWHADGYNSALSDVMSVNQGLCRMERAGDALTAAAGGGGEVNCRALIEKWRGEAKRLRISAGRADKRSRAGVASSYDATELTQAAQDAEAYADELEAALGRGGRG